MTNPSAALNLRDLKGLDPSSRLPLYAQLAERFGSRIRISQAKLAGRALPSEVETAAHFKISRPTVRQAMGQLLSEGLIVRGRGRGTFVAPPHATRDLGRAFEFDLLPANHRVEFQLLSRTRMAAPPEVCSALALPVGEEVERVTRLRLTEGELFAFEERYLPLQYARRITDAMFRKEAGVVFARHLIEGVNGVVRFRVQAMAADAKISRLLKMKKGAPMLASEHTYSAPDGTPVLHGTVLFRGDRYDFRFQAPVHGSGPKARNGS
jgi:GntR family transcriptional regulator